MIILLTQWHTNQWEIAGTGAGVRPIGILLYSLGRNFLLFYKYIRF